MPGQYRRFENRELNRIRVSLLLADKKPVAEIAAIVGVHESYLYKKMRKWKLSGPGRRRNGEFCSQGHRYTQANTRLDKRGYRICRHCKAERQKNRVRTKGLVSIITKKVNALGRNGLDAVLWECRWHVPTAAAKIGVNKSVLYAAIHVWELKRPPEFPKGNCQRDKLVCKRGHRFHFKNTYTDGRGHRYCKTCASLSKKGGIP